MADRSKTELYKMADRSKRTPMIVPDTGSSTEYSSDEEFEQNKSEGSITGSDSGNKSEGSITGSDSDTVSADEDDKKDGIAVDSHDREELIAVLQGDASQAKSQQPVRLERLCLKHSRDSDVTSFAACTSRKAAISCRRVMYASCDAIAEGKVRVDKALKKAEKTGDLDGLNRYRALASKYDAVLKVAVERANMIEAAAECAENAAMTVTAQVTAQMAQKANEVSTAAQISEMSIESIAERIAAANCTAIANMAAIMAYKAEYVFMKSMKTCWEDLDFGNVETRDYPNGSPSETRYSGRKIIAWFGTAVFTFYMCLLAAVSPYTKNPELRRCFVTVAGILTSIPVCFLICQIFVYYRNTEVKQVKNSNLITQIDDRIRELHQYFVDRNITPFVRIRKQRLAT